MDTLDKSAQLLVVNSDPLIQATLKTSLDVAGFKKTIFIHSALQALEILRTRPIDILVCDTEMEELDGWRLTRLVRSGVLNTAASTPIILLASVWCERIAEVTAREYDVNDILSLENIDQLPESVGQIIAAQSRKSTAKPTLLVIEDQEDTYELIKRVLHTRFDIEVADDGEAGLNAWLENRHELVLLDIMLPKMSGDKVLQEILKVRSDQPVVMMTAHAASEQACNLMTMGAVDFVSKPFRAEQLRRVTEIATRREDYLVSNEQFASRVKSLAESEAAYKEISTMHKQLLNNLQTVVMELDDQLRIRFLNESWEIMTGFCIEESLGALFKHFIVKGDGASYIKIESALNAVLENRMQDCELELELRNEKNKELWVQIRVNHSNSTHELSSLTVCLDDVTKRKQAQKQLEHLAMHDSLTGLRNRRAFELALQKFAADADRNRRIHGLLYIDLDHFKVINDTFGHHEGDEVLREISKILLMHVRNSDVLCRLGGDEYAVLAYDSDERKITDLAIKLQKLVSDFNFYIESQMVNLGCSIGISLIDGSTQSSEEYLMRADIALYVAKHRGRKLVHMFDPQDNESEDLRSSINWAQKVKQAIDENRVHLHFQPVLDILKKEVYYYEALVRITGVDGKMIFPGEFIPALENTGEMPMLDRCIIKLAIDVLKDQPSLPRIAINLSAQTFKDDGLVPVIQEALEQTGVNASKITFELTESASLFNLSITQRVIAELHSLGCSFAIDDFGSGFSSFAYLKQLPTDYIKLDGSFIRNLHTDTVDQALVRSIVDVIKALGKKTVAEFVENEEILQLLTEYGVDFAQGYHISRPLPIEEFV